MASPNEERIKALQILHKAGIKTYAFVGPLLPHFVWKEKEMENLLWELKRVGVSYIYLEHINLSKYIRDRLFGYLAKDYPQELEKFQIAQSPKYRQRLDEILGHLVNRVGLKVAYQKPIFHKDRDSWKIVGRR